MTEPYVSITVPKKYRSAYAKFRCGVAPIKIETCRYGINCIPVNPIRSGGGGALKAPPPPPPIVCSHAFNFVAALLCVGDFSQKIV